MANFLLYWKDYWKDVKSHPDDISLNWYTTREGFFNRVQPNDTLWLVVSAREPSPSRWNLVAKVVVWRKHVKRDEIRQFRIIGNPKSSQRFDFRTQPDLSGVLRKLKFSSGKKIKIGGRAIGKRLQSIRRLTDGDVEFLDKHSRKVNSKAFEASIEDAIRRAGASFGDPETNRRVERAAISWVTKEYQSDGWEVESVESEHRGYDLLCKKGSSERHVEVKGIQSTLQQFIITENEKRTAGKDPLFRLCAVMSALTNPRMTEYTGAEVLKTFNFTALAYRAASRRS